MNKGNSQTPEKKAESSDAFFDQFSQILSQVSQGSGTTSTVSIIGGEELLFYGINEKDRELWGELIRYGDDKSIYNAIKAGKSYLLTHVIGNSKDESVQLLRNNEARYGNILLHNRMINAHDESIIKPELSPEKLHLLKSNQKGADYLLRYYELKQQKAHSAEPSQAAEKRREIYKAITSKDIEGKTPLLLSCKNCNQSYALRLIQLDETGDTLNLGDNKEGRTPLHIACILGLNEVAQTLIRRNVDTSLIDKRGHNAFYYLTCSLKEKIDCIQKVLDSVNFFYGRYFTPDDRERVTNEILEKSKLLAEEISKLTEPQPASSDSRKKSFKQ